MARMLSTTRRDKTKRCCDRCWDRTGRFQHGSRKNPRYRKAARAADQAGWKREVQDLRPRPQERHQPDR